MISLQPSTVSTAENPPKIHLTSETATSGLQNALPPSLIEQLVSIYFNNSSYKIPSSESLGGDVTLGAPWGAEYRHSAAYWGDEVFIAARRLTCETWAAANLPAYSYRFNVVVAGIPWPIQVTHFQEVAFAFNNLKGLGYAQNPFQNKSESFTQLSDLISKSWASFVYDLDPNGWTGRDSAVPAWPAYSLENPENIVWDANVTSHTEPDTFRAEGIKLLNENWGLFLR